MKSLNHVQETLLIRVLLYLEILTSEVLMKMMKTVTEARSEPENINQSETSIYIGTSIYQQIRSQYVPESVENRVEEAGVS